MSSQTTVLIMDERAMARALRRIAYHIVEKNQGAAWLALVGIQRRGDWLARRLAKIIEETESNTVPVGILDITLYRDDFASGLPQPVIRRTDIPFDVAGRTIILVDDVLYTGRTIRSALDAVMDFGRPRCIQLAVLIDRGHRELPIQADYVGQMVQTAPSQEVVVWVQEQDGHDEVTLKTA